MTAWLRHARVGPQLLHAFGPRWFLFRARYAAQLRAGYYQRRLPPMAWDARPLDAALTERALRDPAAYLQYRQQRAPRFVFAPDDREAAARILTQWDQSDTRPQDQAGTLVAGRMAYFSGPAQEVGFPPDWHHNPFTGQRPPTDRHWSQISDAGCGDIKAIWEPSRFAFTYTLVRAYWRTGDNQYAEWFWQLVESWRAANPPQHGANWKCGQETSLRVMAWSFGLYGLLDAPATTAQRVAQLAQMVAVSGERIAGNLAYALSQQNNHGISEGLGLWTIGRLFPELCRAERWRQRGRAVLEAQARELIYDDGSFAQHSVNYHRLMLQAYLWAMRLGDVHGEPLSGELRARVRRACDWLYALQDADSGRTPRYGHDDGALILPLNNCHVHDMRPVLQATRYLTDGVRTFADGPWDEDLFWLFGADALASPPTPLPRGDLAARQGGYYTLRANSGLAMTRCATFRHRPGQADLLHVDIWWRGHNIALDAGTFSYHVPHDWAIDLADTACHNTVTVDGKSQMTRVSRFMWLPWARGAPRALASSSGGHLAYWEGQHDGYRQLPDPVTHRRAIIRVGTAHWCVLDVIAGEAPHHYRLHWLLADFSYEMRLIPEGVPQRYGVTLMTPLGAYGVLVGSLGAPAIGALVRADPSGSHGWHAPTYLCLEPALSLTLECESPIARFWSLLGPDPVTVAADEGLLRIGTASGEAHVAFARAAGDPLVQKLSWRDQDGILVDWLEVGQ